MALELVYTSAERGLRPGASGFCTVAMTKGMPPALVARLESLGGYRPGPGGAGPVARCFWRIEAGGRDLFVIAVVGPAPPDHTHRTNKIASYLVLSPGELVAAGPAWLLGQPGLFRESWSGPPTLLEEQVRIPASGPASPRRCVEWERCTGDAGWAGVVASQLLRDPSKPVHVIWREGQDPLALVQEALGLMPDWARWRTTFSTYFLQPVAGVPCTLRMCLDGTPASDAARQSKARVFDLARMPAGPPEGRFVRIARTGIDEPTAGSPRSGPVEGGFGDRGDGPDIELEPLDDEASPASRPAPRRRVGPEAGVAIPDEASPRAGRRPLWIGLLAAGAVVLTAILGVAVFALGSSRRGAATLAREAMPPQAVTSAPASPEPAQGTPDRAHPEARSTEAAVAPSAAPDPPPPATSTTDPSPPRALAPDPAPADSVPSVAGDPSTPAAPEVTPGSTVSPAAPALTESLPPLPSALLGPRWRLDPESGTGTPAGESRWSRSLPSSETGIASVRFVVPDPLRRLGVDVQADGARIVVAGTTFVASASLEDAGRVVRLSASLPGTPLPPPIADCLSPGEEVGGRGWPRLLSMVVLDMVDRSGKSRGLVQCAAAGASRSLDPLAGTEVRTRDLGCVLLLAQVYSDPGAPDQRRLVRQSFIVPGGACVLDVTALVRVSVDRGNDPGAIVARADCPDDAEIGRRRAALQSEAERLGGLVKRLRPLRDRDLPMDARGAGLSALAEAWEGLSDEERRQVSPSSPGSPPNSADGIAQACSMLVMRLEESRRRIVDQIKDLSPPDGQIPKMSLRIVTADGAIVDELPIRRAVRGRRPER